MLTTLTKKGFILFVFFEAFLDNILQSAYKTRFSVQNIEPNKETTQYASILASSRGRGKKLAFVPRLCHLQDQHPIVLYTLPSDQTLHLLGYRMLIIPHNDYKPIPMSTIGQFYEFLNAILRIQ